MTRSRPELQVLTLDLLFSVTHLELLAPRKIMLGMDQRPSLQRKVEHGPWKKIHNEISSSTNRGWSTKLNALLDGGQRDTTVFHLQPPLSLSDPFERAQRGTQFPTRTALGLLRRGCLVVRNSSRCEPSSVRSHPAQRRLRRRFRSALSALSLGVLGSGRK